MRNRAILFAAPLAAATLLLSGCVQNATAGADGSSLTVTSTADECQVSSNNVASGSISFAVSNSTDEVSEFYLLAEDGLRIVGEVENVGPGVTRTLVVRAQPGNYFTVCKPGMVGDGVGKSAFTVTGESVALAGDEQEQIDAAATNYVAYIKDQVGQLVTGTQTFLDAYLAGDTEAARALYPTTRASYERIEPVAESFGDLDPEIDFREADVAEGDEWTGWHRIEKDLFPPLAADNGGAEYVALTPEQRSYYADKLTANTQELYDAVHASDYSVSIDSISNGAIGLLEEVASGKITGEEEIWSHTDLWDFQANLEGARVAYEGVRDIVKSKDADLVAALDAKFDSLESQLATYGSLDTGFVYYTELSTSQVKQLADGVNALSEPLSTLTSVLVG